jgi:hypothetical protein
MPPIRDMPRTAGKEIIFFQGDGEGVDSKLGEVTKVSEFTIKLPKTFQPSGGEPGKKAFDSSTVPT